MVKRTLLIPAPLGTGRAGVVARAGRCCGPVARLAAGLALLLAGGCAGKGAPRAAAGARTLPVGFTADTASRDGLASGASATEAGCRAAGNGLWVATSAGRHECLRYAAAGAEPGDAAGRLALVYIPGDAAGIAYRFAGGTPQVDGVGEGYESAPGTRRGAAAALSGAAGGQPVILLARPGMHGSSGEHARDRHTLAEVELVDAALTELRRRYGFGGFALAGFSSGGSVAANLLARRRDVACAAIASAPLDFAAFYRGSDGVLPDHYALRAAALADPMRTVGAVDRDASVLVLGDPRDRKVPAASWEAWTAAARRAGVRVAASEVSGSDPAEQGGGAPAFHHTAARALEAALACAADASRRGSAVAARGPLHLDRLLPRGVE